MIDAYASMEQYEHHLKPIWDALDPSERGRYAQKGHISMRARQGLLLVAAIGDLKLFCRHKQVTTMAGHVVKFEALRRMILFEHGVGYSFHGDPKHDMRNGSYAGGLHRDKALCLPAVNRWVQENNLSRYPHIPSPIVGCPKLDKLIGLETRNDKPVVCVSFHWDCRVAPETRWAFSLFSAAVSGLRGNPDFDLVAHGHPRAARFFRGWYKAQGIEYIDSFDEVCQRADVYCNDSSSTLYEFAALDRPVVVLNASWYRRDVNHGLRFWERSDVGVQCDSPQALLKAVQGALRDPRTQQKRRREAVAEVYPYLGHATERALEIVRQYA